MEKIFYGKKIYAKNALHFVSIAPETISELRMYFSIAINSLVFDKNFYGKNFYAKNAFLFVSIAPETISELRMHFFIAFNSLTFVKSE